MIGRASVFLNIVKTAVPETWRILSGGCASCQTPAAANLDEAYTALTPGDFSKQVLPVSTEQLAVLRLGNVGWSDLGTPERVMFALARSGLGSH
jgi:hypothetical protein